MWLLQVSFNIVLFLMFLDGLAFIIFKTFSLCKHIAELDLKKTKTRSQQNVVVIDNSFEEVNSVSSEYSSRTRRLETSFSGPKRDVSIKAYDYVNRLINQHIFQNSLVRE